MRSKIQDLEQKLAAAKRNFTNAKKLLGENQIELKVKNSDLKASQVSSVIDYVKDNIWPKNKVANNHLFNVKPEILEGVINHLKMENSPNKSSLIGDSKKLIRKNLAEIRKHKREAMKRAVFGKFFFKKKV